jgi:TRAP-type mannitol/chloroaromatic compound transport system permease small subunit
MSYLIRITRWIDWLSLQAAKLAISLVLICALVSVLNAFSRYAFDLSSNAWLELQWYMFGGIVMLGGAHLLNTNGHIRVDLFYLKLSARQKLWLDLFGLSIFVIPFSVAMTVYSWPWFMEAWYLQEISAIAGAASTPAAVPIAVLLRKSRLFMWSPCVEQKSNNIFKIMFLKSRSV